MAEDRRAKVGYKNPPQESQFKPGQSGNPSGKRKGLKSLATELQEILSETVAFTSEGAIKTMSKQRALASSLVDAAISGDLRATAIVMSHVARASERIDDPQRCEDDFEAVRSYRKRRRSLNRKQT